MNTKLYNELLSYSNSLIFKHKSVIAQKEDLVNEVWDFVSTDVNEIKKKISTSFYSLYGNSIKNISFKEGYVQKIIPTPIEYEKQCIKCHEVKSVYDFSYDITNEKYDWRCKLCKSKAQNKLNANRKIFLNDRIISKHKTFDQLVLESKISLIKNVLDTCKGNKTLACKLLKIERKTFYSIYNLIPKEKEKIYVQPFFEVIERNKKEIIKSTLQETKGNRTKACKLLNISKKTIYNYLK